MFGKKKVTHHFKSREPEHVVLLDNRPLVNVIHRSYGVIEIHYGNHLKQFYPSDASKQLRDAATALTNIAETIDNGTV